MSRERQAGRSPSQSRHGPKVRTADCRKCLFLKSLQDAGVPASTVMALCERMWLNQDALRRYSGGEMPNGLQANSHITEAV